MFLMINLQVITLKNYTKKTVNQFIRNIDDQINNYLSTL